MRKRIKTEKKLILKQTNKMAVDKSKRLQKRKTHTQNLYWVKFRKYFYHLRRKVTYNDIVSLSMKGAVSSRSAGGAVTDTCKTHSPEISKKSK